MSKEESFDEDAGNVFAPNNSGSSGILRKEGICDIASSCSNCRVAGTVSSPRVVALMGEEKYDLVLASGAIQDSALPATTPSHKAEKVNFLDSTVGQVHCGSQEDEDNDDNDTFNSPRTQVGPGMYLV